MFLVKKQYNTEATNTNAKEEKEMANYKNRKITEEKDDIKKPLFTGDCLHNMSVSEGEKLAEASQAIYNAITNKQKEKKEGENV